MNEALTQVELVGIWIGQMDPHAGAAAIRQMLSGNDCRCPGDHAIIQGARPVGAARAGGTR